MKISLRKKKSSLKKCSVRISKAFNQNSGGRTVPVRQFLLMPARSVICINDCGMLSVKENGNDIREFLVVELVRPVVLLALLRSQLLCLKLGMRQLHKVMQRHKVMKRRMVSFRMG
ncbi:hypothetical protein [Thalassoglobus polymorphus]|uniref:hypothetical protein n=1 Tax=Thalassoglobus polymorphus TaxID=2527994 RepID=UPI0011A4FD97|nr:hypothetical protein [Thalassoglobus polymorphus]